MYAAETKTPVGRTRADIEKILTRAGADNVMSGRSGNLICIAFRIAGRRIAMRMALPDPQDRAITHTSRGAPLGPIRARKRHEQIERSYWRACHLLIKAKIEAVRAGITTYEDVFAWDTLTPEGETVGQVVGPSLKNSIDSGRPIALAVPYFPSASSDGAARDPSGL